MKIRNAHGGYYAKASVGISRKALVASPCEYAAGLLFVGDEAVNVEFY